MIENPYKSPESELGGNKGAYHFVFMYCGHRVESWGSSVNGKEWVSIDGEIVSEKQSLSRSSVHEFKYDGVNYKISYFVSKIMAGELFCEFSANGEVVKKYKAKIKPQFNIVLFMSVIAVTIGYGYLSRYLNLPDWSVYIVLFVAVFIGGIASKKEVEIKEVEIK